MNQAEFLNRVVKKVRFLPDRPDIREELIGHLLDSRDWLMETEGWTKRPRWRRPLRGWATRTRSGGS